MTPSVESVEFPALAPTAWPFAVVLGVGVVLVIVMLNGVRFFRGTRAIDRSFWCPCVGRLVDAGFRVDGLDGHRMSVESCSAFAPPARITCEKRCLAASRGAFRAAVTSPRGLR